jgi:GAF domain-containing protein
MGAILLDDPERRRRFSTAEVSLLRSFARHAALAIARVTEGGVLRRRSTQLMRRAERLEAERDAAVQRASEATSRASEVASRSAARSRDSFDALTDLTYGEAKSAFTARYLTDVVRRAGGDLRIAAKATGLPLARLIGLMSHLDVQVEGRGSDGTWGSSVRA